MCSVKMEQWHEAEIAAPDGTIKRRVWVLAKGNTPTELVLNAESQAGLTSWQMDDLARLPTGSHKIGNVKKIKKPYEY